MSAKRKRLGNLLSETRNAAGLSQRDLAALAGCAQSDISRLETGVAEPTMKNLHPLLVAMQIQGDTLVRFMALMQDVDAPGWTPLTLPEFDEYAKAHLDIEQHAREVVAVEHSLVPGLLQIRDYIAAIMLSAGIGRADVLTRTGTRIMRAEVITRNETPTHLTAYIGEAAFHWIVGGPRVMVDQILHIGELSKRPNIHVRIVPFAAGFNRALDGAFTLFDSDFVQVETQESGILLHELHDIEVYRRSINAVDKVALSEDESRAFLANCRAKLEKNNDEQTVRLA